MLAKPRGPNRPTLICRELSLGILIACALTGCGWADRAVAKASGVARTCVDGVMYLQFASGATVAYSPDGSIRTCRK